MKVYFVDSALFSDDVYEYMDEIGSGLTINASGGFSNCIDEFKKISDGYDSDVNVLTNSIVPFIFPYCSYAWNSDLHRYDIYLRTEKGWKRLDELTDRKIHPNRNIFKLFLSGGFDIFIDGFGKKKEEENNEKIN